MNELLDRLESYVPVIAEKLGIASELVYEKLLWYVRIDGWTDLIQIALNILLSGIYWVVALGIRGRMEGCDLKGCDEFDFWGAVTVVYMLFAVVAWLVAGGVMLSIVKIAVPEYYIIKQLLDGLGIN